MKKEKTNKQTNKGNNEISQTDELSLLEHK